MRNISQTLETVRFSGRVLALAAGLVLLALLTAPAFAAADDCELCERQQIEQWPICSPEQIDAASEPTPMRRNSLMNPMMKAATFAREAESPLPGRAQLHLSGVVNAGGASCAGHVAAVLGTDGVRRSGVRQKMASLMKNLGDAASQMGSNGAPGGQPDLQDLLDQMGGKAASGDKQKPHVVLQIYTPNISVQQTGVLAVPNGYTHNGIGGWRANGYANLVLQLPNTRPEELESGKSYPAVVAPDYYSDDGLGGWLYVDWQGQFVPYFQDVPAKLRAANQTMNRRLAETYAGLKQELGVDDNALRGPMQVSFSKGSAFRGTQRFVDAASLKGTVTIDRVSTGSLSGHFELKGTGRLRAERYALDYDSDGQLIGNRKVDSRDFEQKLVAKGRFQAPNYRDDGNVPLGMPVVVSGEGASEEQELLHIKAHSPAIAEKNVDWKQPQICVTFDAAVNLGSLNDQNFYLEYLDANQQLQTVATTYVRLTPKRIRLVPQSDLKDGVRYRVRLKAGSKGIRGRDGRPLDADYGWSFYTMVDLDDDEPMRDLDKILAKTEGIEPHVFQVSRDTKLVPGKPTLTRVYVKWKERDDVAKNWQVKRFRASVQIHADGPRGPVIASKQDVTISRPDQHKASDKRFANNSVNLFNLDISDQPKNIVAEVRPKKSCETVPRKFFSDAHSIPGYVDNPKSLTLAYYLIKPKRAQDQLGSSDAEYWTDGIPDRAKLDAAIIAREGANFTLQNFPVRDVNVIYGGGIAIGIGWASTDKNNVGRSRMPEQFLENGQIPLDYTQKVIEARAYKSLMASRDEGDSVAQSADIFMLFLPPGTAGPSGTGAYAPVGAKPGKPGMIDIWLENQTSGTQYISKHIVDVAHETAHVFGLPHSNRVLQGPPAPYRHPNGGCEDGGPAGFIEGFRIALDGQGGQNKSAVEGNGSSQGSRMYPLMVCDQTPVEGTFIANSSYRTLIDRIQRVAQNDWFGNRILLAANGPVAPRLEQHWAVSGIAKRDGSAALIDGVAPTPRQKPSPAGRGDYEVVLEDANGQTLATRHFALESPSGLAEASGLGSFRVLLPQRAQAKTIVIRHGGKTIQRYARSTHPPTLSTLIAKPQTNGAVTVSWKGHDPDGDTLTYDVYYTANGTDFHPRAIGLRADHFTISAADSFPGDKPALRVVASDGFDQVSNTITLPGHGSFSVLLTLPRAAKHHATGGRIEAAFNADLAPQALTNETFTLQGADGKPVKATTRYRSADHTAILVPDQPLEPGMRYTATLSADIADRYGDTLGEPVSWQFTSHKPPRAPPELGHENGATAQAKAKTDVPSSPTASRAGQGHIQMNGQRLNFGIKSCSQSDDEYLGHTINLTGAGPDGLSVTVVALTLPGMAPTQRAFIRVGTAPRIVYSVLRKKTDQGWTADNGEAAGPLIDLRGSRLTVEADFFLASGDRSDTHARIEGVCPGLATSPGE